MTFENVMSFLPKKPREVTKIPDVQPVPLTTNPDALRTRRNKFAAICTGSKNLKQAA